MIKPRAKPINKAITVINEPDMRLSWQYQLTKPLKFLNQPEMI
jgi:hypothetical protein